MNDYMVSRFKKFLASKGVTSVIKEGFAQRWGIKADFNQHLYDTNATNAIQDTISMETFTSGVFNPAYWKVLEAEWCKSIAPVGFAVKQVRQFFDIPENPKCEKDIFVLAWDNQVRYVSSSLDMMHFVHKYDSEKLLVGIFPTYESRQDFEDYIKTKVRARTHNSIFAEKLPQMYWDYFLKMKDTWLNTDEEEVVEEVIEAEPKQTEEDDFVVLNGGEQVDLTARRASRMSSQEIRIYASNERIAFNLTTSEKLKKFKVTHVAVVELFNGYIALAFNKKEQGVKISYHDSNLHINSVKVCQYLRSKLSLSDAKIQTLKITDLGQKGDYYTVVILK